MLFITDHITVQNLKLFTIYISLSTVSALAERDPVYNFYCFKNNLVFGLNSCTWKYTMHDSNNKTVSFIWRNGNSPWNHIEILPPSRTSINNLNIGTINLIVGINVTSQQQGSFVFTRNLSDVWVVELPPLVGLTGTALNSSCVVLSWETDMYGGFEKELNVNCTSIWGEQKDREFIIYKETKIPICGLLTGRVYNCSTKVRVVTLDNKYPSNNPKYFWWSEYSTASVKTKNDVPGWSPKTTAGAYSWDNTTACQTAKNTGHVWLYWRPLNPLYYNGELVGTKISYNTSEGEVYLQVNKSKNSIRLELRCNRSHVIYIRAVNDVGESKIPSTLQISQPLQNNPPPELIVEVENKDKSRNTSIRYLEWSNPNPNNGDRRTVFYAEKLLSGPTEETTLCDPRHMGPVDWKIINSIVNKTEIVVDDRPYCYALTIDNLNMSSGINWTACVYTKDKVPKSPENIRINRFSNRKGVTSLVEWNKIECSDDQPYIKWYEIGTCSDTSHCKVDVRIPSYTSTVSFNQSSILEPMVAVRAVTRFGVSGNWSRPFRISPALTELSGRQLSNEEKAGIVIGVFGLILITVFFTIGVRKYRRHLYNLRVETPEVIPDIVQLQKCGYNLNAKEKVIDNSESSEDSYVRCDTLILNETCNTNDKRELNGLILENSGPNQFKSIEQRSNDVKDDSDEKFDYVPVTKMFPTEQHQEQDEDEFLQNVERKSDDLSPCYQHHWVRLAPICLLESHDLREAGALGQNDGHKWDRMTKNNSIESEVTKPLNTRKTSMFKESNHRKTNEPNKNDEKMSDNVKHTSNNTGAKESNMFKLSVGYVQSTVLDKEILKRKKESSKTNSILSTGNIIMNAVMVTSSKPSNVSSVLNWSQRSANTESCKSNKSGLVGDYVTSIQTESFHDDTKLLDSGDGAHIEEITEKESFNCCEKDKAGFQNDIETNESWSVEMANRMHEHFNRATSISFENIDSDSSIYSCNDTGKSDKESDMAGYIDQASAAEIHKRHISAENVISGNGMILQSETTFLFPGTVDSDGDVSFTNSEESEKQLEMDGYIDQETAADIICQSMKHAGKYGES